jgi:HEPN domain-containing protein
MLRKQSSDKNPADWFYSASDRLKIADLAWASEGLTQSGIELLQESVERYLKGYLVAKGWILKRTHDLDVLLIEAKRFDVRFDQFRSLADELTRDFFAQPYPGGDWTDLGKNYETLRQQTGSLVELIKQDLPQHFPVIDKK